MPSLFYCKDIDENRIVLDEEESRHAIKVLRSKEGGEIELASGNGVLVLARIMSVGKKNLELQAISKTQTDRHTSIKRAIAIAPTKSIDRMEWFVEKAVEIGIDEIFFLNTQRSERPRINMERFRKIAIGAMKQSRNLYLPTLHDLMDIKDVHRFDYQNKYIAHCMDPQEHLKNYGPFIHDSLIFIGPEGDFTPKEVALIKDAGAKEISLGPSRLRTETAAIYALTVLNLGL